MRSYDTSRTIFAIVEFLAWCSLVLGSLLFVIGLNGIFSRSGFGSNLSAILIIPGVILVVFALLTIVTIQTARAGVDTAELTGQMLRVARDQLEVSRQSLRQGETIQASFEALKQPEPPPAHPRGFETHDFVAAVVRADTPQPSPEPPARIAPPETIDMVSPEPPPAQTLLDVREELTVDLREPTVEPAPAPVFAEAEPIAVEPEPEPIPVDTGPRVFSHKGQTIVRSGADYHVLGQTFADLDAARARIDHFIDERARQRTT